MLSRALYLALKCVNTLLINAKTKLWVHYEMNDKIIASYDDEPMRLNIQEDE